MTFEDACDSCFNSAFSSNSGGREGEDQRHRERPHEGQQGARGEERGRRHRQVQGAGLEEDPQLGRGVE